MDLAQESNHNGDYREEASPAQSVYAETSDLCSAFGDPEVSPRVGEEYQVEVPSLTTKSDYVSIAKINNHDREIRCKHDIHMGLSITVMWINEYDEIDKHKCRRFEKFSDAATNLKQENDEMNMNMVPCSSSGSWSEMEEGSFLLSLYIFGKNLVQVKKFMESNKMEDVLSFYYGKFYRSEKYHRWSECRKMRGRRYIYGQRLFTGWRQHEMLSRLFIDGLEERKSSLLEVSKTFTEGKIRFEEYVFALKAIVGLKDLIEAVGIGKGKQDLTGFAMDPLKSNQAASIRPEIPSGKACSLLTPLEIVKFLTGNFRLSKARTSDLFWEAVWPRLLARGWHSEQPRDHGFAIGPKHPLVFLIPGIEKFSGRKLVRGNHYFDSVSDVLSKVASNPWLLDLADDSDKAGENGEEKGWSHERKLDCNCYLQPRTPNLDSDEMKFTIIDTSHARVKGSEIRELRSLPVGIMRCSNGSRRSPPEDVGSVSSENSIDTLNLIKNKDFSGDGFNHRPQSLTQKTRPPVKNDAKRRQRSLNACDQSELSKKSKPEEATCSTNGFYYGEHSHFQVDQRSSSSSIREHTQETSLTHELIDLNMPVPPDDEIDEPFLAETGERQCRTNQELHSLNTEKTTEVDQNMRRQSCRNRPPTTRALEALALGFLDVKPKRKWKDTIPEEHLSFRPSCRGREKARCLENSRNITEDFKVEKRENSISNSNDLYLPPTMELRALTVNVISAKNLEDVNLMTRMKVYVVVSLSGEVPSDQEFKTVVDIEGRRNPHWNCSMKFRINELAHQFLVFSLRTERVLGDRDVGEVTVPVADLLQSASDGLTYATYQVTKPGKTSCGALYFSYQFGHRIAINLGESPSASGAYSYLSASTAQPTPATYDGTHHPYHVDVYPPPKPLQFPPPIFPPPPIYDAYPPSTPPHLPCYHPLVNAYPTQSAYWATPYPPI